MTEETTQNPGMNISVEQILAAIVKHYGEVTLNIEDLVANYSSQAISVNQNEDKSVTFSLVDAQAATEAVEE